MTGQESESADQLAVNLCGLMIPRKVTNCQHVIAEEKPLVFQGVEDKRAPQFAKPDELEIAAKVDPVLQEFLEQMQNNPNAFSNEHGNMGREKARKIAQSYFLECKANPESIFYAGVPVTVDEQVVASFCLFGPKGPANGFGDEDLSQMEQMSQRASEALSMQLLHKRQAAAQTFITSHTV